MSAEVPAGLARLLKGYGVALTGGAATGKSTVGRLFAAAGVPVVDADQLARAVVRPGSAGLADVAAAFGADFVTAAGELDRARLGALVFRDAERRRQLEGLLHPLIRAALGERLVQLGLAAAPRPFLYEATLIFETRSEGDFRAVWATWCPAELQLTRLMQRAGIDRERAAAVVASQMDARAKAERAAVLIPTGGPLAATERQVMELVRGPPSML